jgi:aspartate/methionine/tyrosine aminotransferase
MPILAKRITVEKPDYTSQVMKWLEEKRLYPDENFSASGGAPSIAISDELWDPFCDTLKKARKEAFSYRPPFGSFKTREKLAEGLRKTLNIKIETPQVWQTFGGQHAIFSSMGMILDPGDKIIKLDPDYMAYSPVAEYLSAEVVEFPILMEDKYQIDVDKLRKVLERDKKNKGVAFSSPANPHTKRQEPSIIKELAQVLIELDRVGIQDIAYIHNTRGTQELLYNYCPENSITIGSGSKCYSTCALNLGYAFTGIKELTEDNNAKLSRGLIPIALTQNSPTELFIQLNFGSEAGKRFIEKANRVYEERQRAMMEALNGLPGVEYVDPDSYYYVYPRFSAVKNSVKFAQQLHYKLKISTVPGLAFGPSGINTLRMTTVTETVEAIYANVGKKMGEFLKTYHD